MEIDWDLQALVRSCATVTSLTTSTTNASTMDELFSLLDSVSSTHDQQEDNLLSFSQFSETRSVYEELDQLYKPFSPNYQSISPQSIPISFQGLMEKQQKPQQTPQKQQPYRSKKRKIQQNRVVCQVPKEGLSSDIWAWRKYGQKPIKGSPYPRGYYKCSTSKGCSARKQVERNPSDPEMFIITYTSEHNHSAPTHRNSLAGSTRQKSSKSQPISITDTGSPTSKPSCSSSSSSSISTDLSPMTSLMASMEDELSQPSKQETREDEEEMVAEDDLYIPDMVMNDLFMGLEELAGPSSSTASITTPIFFDDYFPDNFLAKFPQNWLSDNATIAAGDS